MYNLQKNNYHINPKSSIVYTPKEVSEFIFELLKDKVDKKEKILDPGSGMGSLTAPWKKSGYNTLENDLDPNSTAFWKKDFLQEGSNESSTLFATPRGVEKGTETQKWFRIGLILCNPPFNGYGKKLGSEVWLDKIIELFGKEVPILLFVPMGFRLNSKKSGKRWAKFTKQEYTSISSIISLPRDIFAEVEFHSEILIFNLPNLQPHYFFSPTPKIEQRTPI